MRPIRLYFLPEPGFSSSQGCSRRGFPLDALQRSIRWRLCAMKDLEFAFRQLLKNPGFTAVAVLTLALGIGANTAIFQLVDAIRLRTLAVNKPQEVALVKIADMTGARGSFNSSYPAVTNPLWERIRDTQRAFSGMLAWSADSFNLATSGEPRFARGLLGSG